MAYFFNEKDPREKYKNAFDISNYIKPDPIPDPDSDLNSEPDPNYTVKHFNKNFEYVVVWYEKDFLSPINATSNNRTNGTVTYIDVLFANLTEPTYVRTDNNEEAISYLTLRIHINHIHKLPFGSIWKDGKSKERFTLKTYEVQVSNNYEIFSFSKAYRDIKRAKEIDEKLDPTLKEIKEKGKLLNELPFDNEQYFEKVETYDRNQLININAQDQKFIIHPLSLFIVHYGYSMDIKRIITRFNFNTVEEKLNPKNKDIEKKMETEGFDEFVILPLRFTQRDAVFLHEFKYNENVKSKVRTIHDKVQKAKNDKSVNVRIDFWHKPLTIRFKGIPIGDKVLCANIIGISEPKLNPINLILQPKKSLGVDETKDSQDFLTVRQYVAPDRIEDIDFTHNPVNNLTTLILQERLERIGDLVILNKITNGILSKPIDSNTHFIKDEPPENFGVGERDGKGSTGLAEGFFSVKNEYQSRFTKIWNDAKDYARQHCGIAQWFTYKQGLQDTDEFYVMSLSKFHSPTHKLYLPEYVLVVELQIEDNKYYILEFGEVQLGNSKKFKGFSGIAYETDDGEDFFSENGKLAELLLSVVSLNGTLNSEFTNVSESKIALFKHRDSNSSNWVSNGINNL